MPRLSSRYIGLVLVGLLVGMSGCGSSTITAKGQLLEKGAPLKFEEMDQIALTFYPETGKPEEVRNYTAKVDRQGGFEVRDIPPGKYRVTFQVFGGAKGAKPMPPTARFKGAFNTVATTRIIREVKASEKIDIDLSQSQ